MTSLCPTCQQPWAKIAALSDEHRRVLLFLQYWYSGQSTPPNAAEIAFACGTYTHDALNIERDLRAGGFIPFATPRRPVLASVDGQAVRP